MAKGTGSTSGTVNVGAKPGNSRLASRKSRSKKGQTTFGDVSSQLLQEVIEGVTEEGAMISFSKTIDGGALVIYVKDGSDEAKDYAADSEALDWVLNDLHVTYRQT